MTQHNGDEAYATANAIRKPKKILNDFEKHVGWLQDIRAQKRGRIS